MRYFFIKYMNLMDLKRENCILVPSSYAKLQKVPRVLKKGKMGPLVWGKLFIGTLLPILTCKKLELTLK